MTAAAVIAAIRTEFADSVATPNELRVVYDNAPPPSSVANWVRFSVLVNTTAQVAGGGDGARRYRISGQAVANCFVPAASGDAALLEIADDVFAAFCGVVSTTPIIYYGPPTLTGTAQRDEGWFTRTITIPFEADIFQ